MNLIRPEYMQSKWNHDTPNHSRPYGIKLILSIFAIFTSLTLLFTITTFSWAASRYGTVRGYGLLQQAECSEGKTTNLLYHLLINILSSILLLGSCIFLQVANSPSKREINEAHSTGRWINIGLFSFRNLPQISTKKVLLCCILGFPSITMHLFSNSVIYPYITTNNYYWAVVTEEFLGGVQFDIPTMKDNDLSISKSSRIQYFNALEEIQSAASTYQFLTNHDCIDVYSQKLISDRRNLLLVTQKESSNPVLALQSSRIDRSNSSSPYWICSNSKTDQVCDFTSVIQKADSWTVYGHAISHCLSQQVADSCGIEFNIILAIILMISLTIKLIVEVCILFGKDIEKSINLVGDALAYFLQDQDQFTKRMCLLNRIPGSQIPHELKNNHFKYVDSRPRWSKSVSVLRWTLCSLLICILFLIAIIILTIMLARIRDQYPNYQILGSGFGYVNLNILPIFQYLTSQVKLSLLVNLPQIILTILFIITHGIWSAIFTAREYSSFAFKAQYIRSSFPTEKQKCQWTLNMPTIWGVTFLTVHILLQLCMSQSIFVINFSTYNEDGTIDSRSGAISNLNFSPLATICSLVGMGVILISLLLLALQRFPSRCPPIFANCSAAISAACQSGDLYETNTDMKLIWGWNSTWSNGVGHCSFSNDDYSPSGELRVSSVIPGRYYT